VFFAHRLQDLLFTLLDLVHPLKIKFCFQLLKRLLQSSGVKSSSDAEAKQAESKQQQQQQQITTTPPPQLKEDESSDPTASSSAASTEFTSYQDEIRKLRLMVQARDNEISILVGMLKQGQGAPGVATQPSDRVRGLMYTVYHRADLLC
jgi:hypothetical protein